MKSLRAIADALLRLAQEQSEPASRLTGPSRAAEYEVVDPDGRLVSGRGAVRIWSLDSQHAVLPDDNILYISRDYPNMRFHFTFARCADGSYRAYIRSQPSYHGLRSDVGSTHRLHDPRNGYFICWQPGPRDAVTVLRVAKLWAERTARYVAAGTELEAP